jgi:ABC-2 type transport system ATP-binding protein
MMDSIIQCENITHYYGKRLIYENLNFTVGKGKILGLLGKNGTGKTTIINILNGYLKPYSGTCRMFGEDMRFLSPETKARIGLLLEGHVQHSYFNIVQIEKFYAQFYPNWKSEPYWELMSRLKVTKKQKLSTMSCGQRSQVALGLILAQDPELLILDDFSMGLDPGYRRLFVDYLREYVTASGKTVFLTSHIIQDMEQLIDETIILDFGKILLHKPTSDILSQFRRFRFNCPQSLKIEATDNLYHPEVVNGHAEVYSFLPQQKVIEELASQGFTPEVLSEEKLNLEDAFIGLTGKY